ERPRLEELAKVLLEDRTPRGRERCPAAFDHLLRRDVDDRGPRLLRGLDDQAPPHRIGLRRRGEARRRGEGDHRRRLRLGHGSSAPPLPGTKSMARRSTETPATRTVTGSPTR